jgi:hypothetical protein
MTGRIHPWGARAVAGAVALGVLLAAGLGGLSAQADKPKLKDAKPAVEDRAATGTAPGEAAAAAAANSATPPAPTRRGAYTCDIHIDNRTPFIIHRVYIDGRYWGSVGRGGDAIARDVLSGGTRVYAEADFSDGPKRYWGPRVFDCESFSTFTWTLR